MMAGKDDEDYIEVMRDRTATNEVNEYTKRPGPIPEYLSVIDDTEVVVPSANGKTSVSEHGNPTFDGGKPHHKYENDAYLHPLSHAGSKVEPAVDSESVTSPDEKVPAAPPSADKGKPYFVNPPIADDYISPAGHDKLAQSGNIPRGELYRGKTTKPPPLPKAEVTDKVSLEDEEAVNEKLIEPTIEEAADEYVNQKKIDSDDYVNQKKMDSGEQGVNYDVDVVDGGQGKSAGVKNLAAMFGGSSKTSDYANQPAHAKREGKQQSPSAGKDKDSKDENVVVQVKGMPHKGNVEDGYITCS